MTDEADLKTPIEKMLQKASRSIAASKRHIEAEDYDFEFTISADDAKEDLQIADRIVSAIAKYLNTKIFKTGV